MHLTLGLPTTYNIALSDYMKSHRLRQKPQERRFFQGYGTFTDLLL